MTYEKVLSMLKKSGEEYCSGEMMSRSLGISRAAVWKAVKRLRQDGYEIDSMPKRGYRLGSSPDRLSAGELSGALEGCTIGSNIICLDCVDSTNNYAKELGNGDAPHGTVVLTEQQTGGRGRSGKSFDSPVGKGLYLTILLRPTLPPADMVYITAWTAVAICDAVETVAGVRPGIKWTNDIILHGRKLCGILTEMGLEAESGRLQYVVVGVGMNVSQTAEDFSGELEQVAISLEQALGHKVRRAELAAAIIRRIDRMMQEYPTERDAYLRQYRADCLTTGHQVRLIQRGETCLAYAEEIDKNFGLIVRLDDGTRESVTAGDVSVRGLLGYV